MAEEKKDSFWESKNDDFWNKPVISDDWLKSKDDSFWGTENVDIKEDSSVNEAYVRNEYPDTFLQESVAEESHYTPQQVQDIIEGKKVKKKHIHTKICLVAICLTVLAGILSVLINRRNIAVAMEDASYFHGTEQFAEKEIILNEHDVLLLDDTAYTIVPEINESAFYERVKVVAIYAELFSDYYENSAYDSLRPYVGYETEKGREYKMACDNWNTSEYSLENTGFSENHFLYSYTGKGYDSAGYYFYVVPVDVTELKIYVETYSYKPHHKTVENIFVKDIYVEDSPDIEELLSRKVVQ